VEPRKEEEYQIGVFSSMCTGILIVARSYYRDGDILTGNSGAQYNY
jgi:hypothetical protein